MDLMIHNTVTPAVNQIEVNPFLQQGETQRFLQANGVQPEAWAPFAEGRNHIFENPTLRSVASKHKKSVAQIILRWLSQRGIVVLSKTVRKERMAENFDVLDFELSADDMAAIATLDTGTSSFFDHRPSSPDFHTASPSIICTAFTPVSPPLRRSTMLCIASSA